MSEYGPRNQAHRTMLTITGVWSTFAGRARPGVPRECRLHDGTVPVGAARMSLGSFIVWLRVNQEAIRGVLRYRHGHA